MNKIRSYIRGFTLLLILVNIAVLSGCNDLQQTYNNFTGNNRGDIDLEDAIPLLAQAVPHPGNGDGTIDPIIPGGPLFDLQPGTFVALQTIGTTVDVTGTTLSNDYDGDGILNTDEMFTNMWAANYPEIETSIATPVTMRIEILESKVTTNDEIVSEINSDDSEATSSDGSERIHQTETALKTREFQDSYSKEDELSHSQYTSMSTSMNYNAGLSLGPIGASVGLGGSHSTTNATSWSAKTAYSETKTKWKDVPFKNNLDNNNWRVKSNSASTKARNFRNEYSTKIDSTSKVDANAGFVRAALYIKNNSIDMPVHLSNILCTLMFEAADGTLLPVQSFRLRNDDFSIFEIEVYGGSQFGPYVIELSNLNTSEIRNAIAMGYSPKIFIVDYDMTHVPNSLYRDRLANFSGDNLKMVEENAKSRSALFRIFGPNLRAKYRVPAFTFYDNAVGADGFLTPNPDPCAIDQGTQLAPGIPLFEALRRLSCSGTGLDIKFGDYMMDLDDLIPELKNDSRLLIRTIKSVAGIPTRMPTVAGTCVPDAATTPDPNDTEICINKPITEWTDEERNTAGVWAIFANGTYYNHTGYLPDAAQSDNIKKMDLSTWIPGATAVPVAQGTDSFVWAGDHFDLVYLRYQDLAIAKTTHGNNPLETKEVITLSTEWDSESVGANAFNPNVNSLYLGQAGFNERVMLKFNLLDTWYLNPDFGEATIKENASEYFDFTYNSYNSSDLFSLEQSVDFEFSLGISGERSDWFHVLRDLRSWSDPTSPDAVYPASCGYSVDFVNQTFNLCINLPAKHTNPLIDPYSSVINLYLRPALNLAYRNTVWPKKFDSVNEFDGTVFDGLTAGEFTVRVKNIGSGLLTDGDTIYLETNNGFTTITESIQITTVSTPEPGIHELILATTTLNDAPVGARVWKPTAAPLATPDVVLSLDDGFITDWNTEALADPVSLYSEWRSPHRLSLLDGSAINCSLNLTHSTKCLGFDTNYMAGNWMGANNYGIPNWNNWSDGGGFANFLNNGLPVISTSAGLNMSLIGSQTPPLPGGDALLNSTNTDNDTEPVIVGDENYSVAVWKYETATQSEIHGSIFEVGSGSAGSEFIISTTNEPSRWNKRPQVAIHGDRALVVWESYSGVAGSCPIDTCDQDIRGRIIDLTTMMPVGVDFEINLTENNVYQGSPAVAVFNNRAYVAWWTNGTPNYFTDGKFVSPTTHTAQSHHVMGRMIDISSDIPTITGEDDTLGDWDEYIGKAPICCIGEWRYVDIRRTVPLIDSITVNNNSYRFTVAWAAQRTDYALVDSLPASIRYRMVDSSGSLLGTTDTAISTETVDIRRSPQIAINGDQGLAVWEEDKTVATVTDSDIKCRLFDLNSGIPMGEVITVSSSNPSLNQTNPRLTISGNRVAIAWLSDNSIDNDVYGRIMNVQSGTFINETDILVSNSSAFEQNQVAVSTNGGLALYTWTTKTDDINNDIRGRLVDMVTGKFLDVDFLINSTQTGEQNLPAVSINNEEGYVIWVSDDAGPLDIRYNLLDIRRGSVYGLNNFFVSPLIRRNFEVQTEILMGY